MATVTVTIKDVPGPEGMIDVDVEYDPPIDEHTQNTSALQLGQDVLSWLMEQLGGGETEVEGANGTVVRFVDDE